MELVTRVLRLLLGLVVGYLIWLCCWLWIYCEAFAFRLYSKDKKRFERESKLPQDRSAVQSVRLIFIRHGESTWNDTFNRTKIPHKFAWRLLYSAVYETMLMMTGSNDSWFLDSPLSEFGLSQAEDLQKFLRTTAQNPADPLSDDCKLILGQDDHVQSRVVVSNLRRCVSTCMVGLWDRIQKRGERVLIHTALQEISKNPDTVAITKAGEVPKPSWLDELHTDTKFAGHMAKALDPSMNMGTKSMDSTGQQRLLDFAAWASDTNINRGPIVCVGHSFWFREFCREFMPKSVQHDIKTKKITNCGVVMLTMTVDTSSGKPEYCVDPASLKTIYGGYTTK
eukprot:m.24442 g.24442  ORF g.24442 m.24442 type:complete len:338 (+) comp4160_c0_seq2:169-1182(+)